jgi:hypothetical protein
MSGRQESRRRLATLRPDIARHAFTPLGCLVCDACRAQMAGNPSMCPLRVFHDATQSPGAIDFGAATNDQRPTTNDPPPITDDLELGAVYSAWWAERGVAEESGLLVGNTASLERIVRQWFYWLAQRGWPEATEALWSRMLAFLREEGSDSTENR